MLARGNTLRSDEDRLKLKELMKLYDDIALVSVQDDADKVMFDVDALDGEEVFVAGQNENVVEEVIDAAQVSTAATTVTITTKEITLAQALEALKTSKPKVKGIFFQEPEERLQEEKAEKEQESNIALIEIWDDIQAKIDADHQLAERLQAQEQEELSVEEKATLFQQLLAQEITKKQKVEDDKEISEIKKLIEIILNEKEIYMLVEKKYPLTPATLTIMLEKKLMIDYESEMAYQLLKFIVK
ncbi:hypothetical protein Tco_1291354 [Tanacetum coccineum]